MQRICGKCRTEKSLDDFYRDKNKPRGRSLVCKPCSDAYRRDPGAVKRAKLTWYHRNREQEKIKARLNRQRFPMRYKATRAKHLAKKKREKDALAMRAT